MPDQVPWLCGTMIGVRFVNMSRLWSGSIRRTGTSAVRGRVQCMDDGLAIQLVMWPLGGSEGYVSSIARWMGGGRSTRSRVAKGSTSEGAQGVQAAIPLATKRQPTLASPLEVPGG